MKQTSTLPSETTVCLNLQTAQDLLHWHDARVSKCPCQESQAFHSCILGEPRTHAYDLLLELWAKLWQITLGWCQWKMQYQYTHIIKCSPYMSAGCQHIAPLSSWTMPRPLNESQPYESGFFDRTDLLRHVYELLKLSSFKRISSRRSWPYFLLFDGNASEGGFALLSADFSHCEFWAVVAVTCNVIQLKSSKPRFV